MLKTAPFSLTSTIGWQRRSAVTLQGALSKLTLLSMAFELWFRKTQTRLRYVAMPLSPPFVLTHLGQVESGNGSNKSGSWFSRKILRKTSSTQSIKTKNDRLTKHRRSISDLSLRLISKSDTLKDKDLQELVRLCGLSLLYLPTEYAASSLAVPTCFRATAQYLVQHGELWYCYQGNTC
jgi:hypothetical protein